MSTINRQAVHKKYDGRCAYCGKKIDYKDMQVDHIIPQRNGGTDDFDNLNPSCRRCNHYKSALTLEQFREQLSTLLSRLNKVYIYKVALDYSMVDEREVNDLKFYFEKY